MGPVKAESSDAVATQNVPRKKTLPAFIRKLWIIFMDSANSHLAHWSNDGRIICIPNATQFSANVLPRYFKHNNWPSFVRQLNLYGFRKVCETNIDSCKWRSEQEWQFKHDYFRKGAPQLLVNIERRIPGHRSSSVCENSQSSETPEVTPAIPESNPGTTNCQSPLESIRRLESLVKSLEQKSMLLYNHVGQIRTLYTHQNQTLADLIEKVEDTFTSREARDPTMSGPRKVPNAGSDASLSSQSMAADTTYMHCRQYPEWRCDDQTKTYPHDIPFLTSKSSVPNRAGADRDLPPAFLTPDGRSILAAAAGDQSSNHHLLAFGQQPPSSSCV